jgi:3-oxoacyl-[acyl-carrier protein] reductase
MIADSLGRLDIVINNAGIIRVQGVAEVTVSDFDLQVATNIRAPLMVIQEALPLLKRSDCASVVNVSSSSAALNRPGQSVYSMTKAAFNHLTRSMAAELAPDGIRVNAVAPGPVDTRIHLAWPRDRAEAAAGLAPQIPLSRLARPEEVARWVLKLCDADSSWVSGRSLQSMGVRRLILDSTPQALVQNRMLSE